MAVCLYNTYHFNVAAGKVRVILIIAKLKSEITLLE